jgi:carbon monoxide dehydrogenase subunit G
MTTIRREIQVAAPPEQVWSAFADFGAPHERIARGFVVSTELEEGARVVTFANGLVARERLVTMDQDARRLVYSVEPSERLSHHNASFQVLAEGAGSRVVWIADILPDAMAEPIGAMMDAGVAAMRTALG